jgi:hypothetical protein
LEVSTLYVSEPLLAELKLPDGRLDIGEPESLRWTKDDRLDLVGLFPDSHMARRHQGNANAH